MRKKEEELRAENLAKRDVAKDLEKFDAQIRGDDSGLSLGDLKKLNSVKKRHYIDNLIEEDNVLVEFLKGTEENVGVALDDNNDMQMEVGDVLDDYKQNIRKINEALNKKAIENGITVQSFRGGFKEFNIKDMVKAISTCKVCFSGKVC